MADLYGANSCDCSVNERFSIGNNRIMATEKIRQNQSWNIKENIFLIV